MFKNLGKSLHRQFFTTTCRCLKWMVPMLEIYSLNDVQIFLNFWTRIISWFEVQQFAFGCCRQIEESSIEKPQRTSADTKGRKRKKRLKLAKRSQKPSQFMIIHNQSKFFLNWNMLGLIHMHTRTYLKTETFTNEIKNSIKSNNLTDT